MVEKEVMEIIQIFSWVATGTGVCFAAYYYVMTLRNTENTRRKDIISQRLQTPLQFYEAYGEIMWDREITSYETMREKLLHKPKEMARVWYVLNHFNSLGILVQEGLATSQQVFKQYLPQSVIVIYEKFRGEIVNSRYRHAPKLEVWNPDAYMGFEFLYEEAKRLYPMVPQLGGFTREELIEHAREIDELLKAEVK